jgi:hypothetical protein
MPKKMDNELIYFIEIYFDDFVYRLSKKDYVLNNGQYEFKGNLKEDFNLTLTTDIESFSNLIANQNEFVIKIARYTDNGYLSGYFNSLYPTPNKTKWLNRKVRIGIGWEGIYAYAMITWIYEGWITNYEYDYAELTFTIGNQIVDISIPNELITKEEFPNAPEQSIGRPKPIVFGEFNKCFLFSGTNDIAENYIDYFLLAPAILVDKLNGTFFVCQHKNNLDYDNLFVYYGNSKINGYRWLVYYDLNTNASIGIINRLFENGLGETNDENNYLLQLLIPNAENDLRIYFKYRPTKVGKFVAYNYAGSSIELIKRTSWLETQIFGNWQMFSFELDALPNNTFGDFGNTSYFKLVIKNGPARFDLYLYKKSTGDLIILADDLNIIYPITFLQNYFYGYQETLADYQLMFVCQQSSNNISTFFLLGYDVPLGDTSFIGDIIR